MEGNGLQFPFDSLLRVLQTHLVRRDTRRTHTLRSSAAGVPCTLSTIHCIYKTVSGAGWLVSTACCPAYLQVW
jgi:hypothetical protein